MEHRTFESRRFSTPNSICRTLDTASAYLQGPDVSPIDTMLRSLLLRRKTPAFFKDRLPKRRIAAGPSTFGRPHHGSGQSRQLPPVRAIVPALWSLTVTGAIFLGCAAYSVQKDADEVKKGSISMPRLLRRSGLGSEVTFDEIEAAMTNARARELQSRKNERMDFSSPPAFWHSLDNANKAIAAIAASNAGVFMLNAYFPSTRIPHFSHVATSPKNYTLLTSIYGHSGSSHFFVNMSGLYLLGPKTAHHPIFQGSGSHFTAFYISSGILSSLTQHLSAIWPMRQHLSVPSLGASGAIYAVFGAYCVAHPDAQLGLILYLPAQQFLALTALFETYGLFVGFKKPLGHGAHMGGLALGSAYAYFDGKQNVWQPARRFAFTVMRWLGMV